jgi:hypothetical protein
MKPAVVELLEVDVMQPHQDALAGLAAGEVPWDELGFVSWVRVGKRREDTASRGACSGRQRIRRA